MPIPNIVPNLNARIAAVYLLSKGVPNQRARNARASPSTFILEYRESPRDSLSRAHLFLHLSRTFYRMLSL
jgi:hypothetical protein